MSGYKTWVDLEILTAADLNGYLMQQAVPRFATTGARSTAIPSPATGQLSYVTGVGVQVYNGTAWALIEPSAQEQGASYFTGGAAVTSSGSTETAMSTWTSATTYTFAPSQVYELELAGAYYASASSEHTGYLRVRKGVNSTAGVQLLQAGISTNSVGSTGLDSFTATGFVKNATGANVTSALGVTITRSSGAANLVINGDTLIPLVLRVTRLGNTSDANLANLAAIAAPIT